jgi:hypothetical protein
MSDGAMRQSTRLEQGFCYKRTRFTFSTILPTTMSHSRTALPARTCDSSSSATAIPTTTSIGRDTHVSSRMLALDDTQIDILYLGTNRFFDINKLDKPEGWQDQSG